MHRAEMLFLTTDNKDEEHTFYHRSSFAVGSLPRPSLVPLSSFLLPSGYHKYFSCRRSQRVQRLFIHESDP
eukprot:scaffold8341_cov135-Skeletonema_menzelii.AAC.4